MHIETSIPKLSVARPFSVARSFSVVILISVEGFVYVILIMRYHIIYFSTGVYLQSESLRQCSKGQGLVGECL